MHSKLDRLENNKGFIDWLKQQGYSSEIINRILEFNNEDFSVFKERVVEQPNLLTALVENGYDSKAINLIFLRGNDQMYKDFLKYKSFVIKFLQNQCPIDSLEYLYYTSGYFFGKKIFQHRNVYIALFRYFSREIDDILFNNTIVHLFNYSKPDLNKLRNNLELFFLLMINGIPHTLLNTLIVREDFKNLKINDNQELLNFLLNNQLIIFDEDKLNLIRGHPLVTSLLKIGHLTVADLQYKCIEEIQRKADELSKNRINENHKQLGLPSSISKNMKLTCDNKVWSLQTFATAVIIENMKKEKLPGPSLSSVRTTCTETSRCVIS